MSKEFPHFSTTVPAGFYWVGDPCYTIPDEDWMAWLEAANYQEEGDLLEADLGDGKYAVGLSTAYGDGSYNDRQGREYFVDAGLIGLVSVLWNQEVEEKPTTRYLVKFDAPTEVWTESGTLHFGMGITIYTNDLGYDDPYEEDWDAVDDEWFPEDEEEDEQ